MHKTWSLGHSICYGTTKQGSSWHLPPQRQTSLHWCSCTGWLFHTLLLFLGNPCCKTYLWDEPASKSTGRWKHALLTLQWVRQRAGGIKEGSVRKTLPELYYSCLRLLWELNVCFFVAVLSLYWILVLFIWEVPVISGFWHSWTCVKMWSKLSKLRISIIIRITNLRVKDPDLSPFFWYLTEVFRWEVTSLL